MTFKTTASFLDPAAVTAANAVDGLSGTIHTTIPLLISTVLAQNLYFV